MTKPRKFKKELVLDYRKWRCGFFERDNFPKLQSCLGKGPTALLNKKGYMCCLGQFCKQSGYTKDELLDVDEPSNEACSNLFINSAIDINDCTSTTIPEKLKKLNRLCSKYKKKLILKNFPKSILKEVPHITTFSSAKQND